MIFLLIFWTWVVDNIFIQPNTLEFNLIWGGIMTIISIDTLNLAKWLVERANDST